MKNIRNTDYPMYTTIKFGKILSYDVDETSVSIDCEKGYIRGYGSRSCCDTWCRVKNFDPYPIADYLNISDKYHVDSYFIVGGEVLNYGIVEFTKVHNSSVSNFDYNTKYDTFFIVETRDSYNMQCFRYDDNGGCYSGRFIVNEDIDD